MEGLKNEARHLAEKYSTTELQNLMMFLHHEVFAKQCGFESSQDMENQMYFQGIVSGPIEQEKGQGEEEK